MQKPKKPPTRISIEIRKMKNGGYTLRYFDEGFFQFKAKEKAFTHYTELLATVTDILAPLSIDNESKV